MKKIITSLFLMVAVLASVSLIAYADQGATVAGISGGGTQYKGAVDGESTQYGCYAETKCYRVSGTESVYAYVEIVNYGGYLIGNGKSSTGTSYACSGTQSMSGGYNAYGSIGTASGTSRTFCRLY
ncbi:hypothetical protein [Candidatus Clostridium stratigraminis]|uniref:Uncharacterized protein n=1 Tax=Candidatus Clostridium stratigraminis TaxID=3381661 RepID=A0ABW8T739_9CLOT